MSKRNLVVSVVAVLLATAAVSSAQVGQQAAEPDYMATEFVWMPSERTPDYMATEFVWVPSERTPDYMATEFLWVPSKRTPDPVATEFLWFPMKSAVVARK